jgi:hypothetical protein
VPQVCPAPHPVAASQASPWQARGPASLPRVVAPGRCGWYTHAQGQTARTGGAVQGGGGRGNQQPRTGSGFVQTCQAPFMAAVCRRRYFGAGPGRGRTGKAPAPGRKPSAARWWLSRGGDWSQSGHISVANTPHGRRPTSTADSVVSQVWVATEPTGRRVASFPTRWAVSRRVGVLARRLFGVATTARSGLLSLPARGTASGPVRFLIMTGGCMAGGSPPALVAPRCPVAGAGVTGRTADP